MRIQMEQDRMFRDLTESQIRSICREKIESLEHWLRRFIDEQLSSAFGDYFSYVDDAGNRLFKKSIVDALEDRCKKEPERYTRKIDAVLLEDAIDIICNPQIYSLFKVGLESAFPDGREEARTFMRRVLDPRNRLAHSNPISLHQAEQVVCYCSDITESLKRYYGAMGMQNDYNVPTILRFSDSLGNHSIIDPSSDRVNWHHFGELPTGRLWPGDTLTVEIEVDPAFAPGEYTVQWGCSAGSVEPTHGGLKVTVRITTEHIGQSYLLWCDIISNKEWHKLSGKDDQLCLYYRVLPCQ